MQSVNASRLSRSQRIVDPVRVSLRRSCAAIRRLGIASVGMTVTRRSTRPRAARFVPNDAPSGHEQGRHANASPNLRREDRRPTNRPDRTCAAAAGIGIARVTVDWSSACSSRSTPSLRLALRTVPVTPARLRLRRGTVRNRVHRGRPARRAGGRALRWLRGDYEGTTALRFAGRFGSRRRRAPTRLAGLLAR